MLQLCRSSRPRLPYLSRSRELHPAVVSRLIPCTLTAHHTVTSNTSLLGDSGSTRRGTKINLGRNLQHLGPFAPIAASSDDSRRFTPRRGRSGCLLDRRACRMLHRTAPPPPLPLGQSLVETDAAQPHVHAHVTHMQHAWKLERERERKDARVVSLTAGRDLHHRQPLTQ